MGHTPDPVFPNGYQMLITPKLGVRLHEPLLQPGRMLTGWIFCGSGTGNHGFCEFLMAAALLCPEDTISPALRLHNLTTLSFLHIVL